jgi:hypothetical protein
MKDTWRIIYILFWNSLDETTKLRITSFMVYDVEAGIKNNCNEVKGGCSNYKFCICSLSLKFD